MAEDDVVSSPPAPAVAFRQRWDVFLSFRGEDTRERFTMSLYESLNREGVRAFLDDDGLNRGDEIAPSLLEAIDDSAAAVVVLSPRYGDSRWCLEELAKICECRGKLILPVFYQVDPSHVRRQTGPFEEDFRIHERRFGVDKVLRWRRAMEKVGGIAGWVFKNGRRAMEKVGGIAGWVFKNGEKEEIIKHLVKSVLSAIRKTPVGLASYTVGLESRLEEATKMLDVKSNGIRVLGIHGMGGVGKTTLATALFNKVVGHFEHRSFVSSVREISAQEDGLVSLQNKLIKDLSNGSDVDDVNHGIASIKRIVNERRVLVVLDDVDNVSQLNAVMAKRKWFYEGSRIIITTRDQEVLQQPLVDMKYEVRELDTSEALKLFSYHALRKEKPTGMFFKLSEQIVLLTGGLPLALEVFGSMLFDKRRIEEWKDALQKLKQIRPANLQDVLKISYDALDEQEKCIFLDISCQFVTMGMDRDYAVDILKACGFGAETAITDLTAKSLIKITEENTLWMHDQVRDMGRQIVWHENPLDPCMRSRLWDRDDIMTVFLDDERRKCTQGIVLDLKRKRMVKDPDGSRILWNNLQRSPSLTYAIAYLKERYKEYQKHQAEKKREITIRAKPLRTMVNLRLLQINYINLEGQFQFPSELKWLEWKGCRLKSFSSDFGAKKLAILDLSHSKVERLWSWHSNEVAENLKILNLSDCYYLAALPNLSGNQKLEKLILKHCVSLTKIDEYIGNMNALIHLNLTACSNLIEFPTDVSGLKRLENLILSGCSKLKRLPENLGSMRSLKELLVDETAIESLPESIFHLTELEKLILNRCSQLKIYSV
ncbi:TMV resistance protein N [Morus notabilis]|uniref:TMV resistance protein N n=1 Tax=Morus notabilis TaxID=981085 RepID=W9RVC0_9ROSA|nr:TMV resistance protein N [Morus notabilis]